MISFTTFKVLYDISIHSLRVEGDREVTYLPATAYPISIHSLRVEGDSVTFQ